MAKAVTAMLAFLKREVVSDFPALAVALGLALAVELARGILGRAG
eukprot:CAMPEP_0174706754 /NCGR_PEP_ID=MMETSP1094-20130205/9485_1 /TAXON_ID=156173 /ORGANISM="Chrysochromulina brevifilum, Strain UTEX LB 985" /LENGTH=44 /DNA_ID= /DNA_START= /DNA_END= /DNA_ORIENTATION=